MLAVALGLALVAAAPPPDRIGRIYHYVRSNRDGSLPEQVHVFRRTVDRIEVYKMVRRCTDAALVQAELDPATLQTRRLIGGKLGRDARPQEFAWLDQDAATRVVTVRLGKPDAAPAQTVTVPDAAWHLYDFDLASLTVAAPRRADPRADFSFGLPLILVEPDRLPLRYLGRADAHFVGEATHRGRAALRFAVGGPAFGKRGGTLWFDRADGHILAAAFGLPNHAEYRDFKLELRGLDDGGAAGWQRLLDAHWAGCPAQP